VLFTIRDLLEMHVAIASSSNVRIEAALHKSLSDPQFIARDSAIDTIEYFDTREQFVPLKSLDTLQSSPMLPWGAQRKQVVGSDRTPS